jgi:hypothetical protein
MIDQFGKEPQMAAALLEFLQVLAEEYNSRRADRSESRKGRSCSAGSCSRSYVICGAGKRVRTSRTMERPRRVDD